MTEIELLHAIVHVLLYYLISHQLLHTNISYYFCICINTTAPNPCCIFIWIWNWNCLDFVNYAVQVTVISFSYLNPASCLHNVARNLQKCIYIPSGQFDRQKMLRNRYHKLTQISNSNDDLWSMKFMFLNVVLETNILIDHCHKSTWLFLQNKTKRRADFWKKQMHGFFFHASNLVKNQDIQREHALIRFKNYFVVLKCPLVIW